MRIVFDLETDGLLDSLTRIHSLVLRERGTGKLLLSCTDDPRGRAMGYASVAEGLALMAQAERLYAHNGIKFDIPAIRKLYPEWTTSAENVDTFVIAAFRWAHIADHDYEMARRGVFPANLAGRHGLEAWGHRLGLHKGDYTDWCARSGIEDPWSEWRPEMQTYCELDTEVTEELCRKIARTEAVTPEAVRIEHAVAEYLAAQERNGWPFDVEAAVELNSTLAARRAELEEQLTAHFGFWYAPDKGADGPNGYTVPKVNNKTRGVTKGVPFSKIKRVDFNAKSGDHLADRLTKLYRWVPDTFTPTGKPQVDEKALKKIRHIPIVPVIMEFLLVKKRLEQISEGKQAWLLQFTDQGPRGSKLTGVPHVHGQVWQSGCVTHRASHSRPNLAQVPKVGSPYGEECRALFRVPPGWVQVGADASGLELRCLSHYMARWDGGAYGTVILEGKNEDGTDIHSVNRNALGLEGKTGRDQAKTFIYAYLYGAGDAKLGSIVAPGDPSQPTIGKRLRGRFESNLPALGSLVTKVKAKAKREGFLELPDGRRAYVRHQHAALNTLLQGAGAVICKAWIADFAQRLTDRFGPQGWDGQWAALGWIHDEVQIATRPEIAAEVSEILVESIRSITDLFAWRCPLDGEAKTGQNWAMTH